MPAYVADCKSCGERLDIDWDGDQRLLPVPATCPHCAHPDGYCGEEVHLVGAFQVTCEACGGVFSPQIPATNIDYSAPTGLKGPIELTCNACAHTGWYSPSEVAWLGQGESMPQASARAGGVGQNRP